MLKFWRDGEIHSLKEFRGHLREKGIHGISMEQCHNTINYMVHKGSIERVGRGLYIIGNFPDYTTNENPEENVLKNILRRAQKELSAPVNIIFLKPEEREFIDDIQNLYMDCERIIQKIDERGSME